MDEGNAVYFSAASAWEIATKHRLGKLPSAAALALDIAGTVETQGFVALPISLAHAGRAGALPGPHRDPFDRMLIAQAQAENLVLLTADEALAGYGAAVRVAR